MTRSRWGFSLYDFANSAYVLIFGTLLFPIFFREHIFAGSERSDFYWGLTLSVSIILAIILAPLVGYLSDRYNRRWVMAVLVLTAGLGMLLLATLIGIQPLAYAALFVATHALFVLSVAVYDSFLSHVGPRKDRTLISSFAWGFGYLGGIACFLIVFLSQGRSLDPTGLAFGITAAFFLVFALLSLSLLPKQKVQRGFQFFAVVRTIVDWHLGKILLAFWLINEGIVTITYFTALFGRVTLALDIKTIGMLFLLVQVGAFPGTWLMGRAAKRWGQARVILLTIGLWCVVLVGLMFATNVRHLMALSVVSAFVIGSTQALMRAYYSNHYPDKISGFSFGLYTIASRAAALVGPLLFGFVSSATGSQRVALITALIPLLAGAFLFRSIVRGPTERLVALGESE